MDFAALTPWLAFSAGVGVLLWFDLSFLNKRDRVMGMREALGWTAGWVGLALAFAVFVWQWKGPEAGQQFLAGYLIEESLSIDNLFVFVIVFAALGIGAAQQRRVLFWGVLGAIVFRLIFILGGVALIERFHWIIYIFGAFLVFTAFKMWRSTEMEADPQKNPIVRLVERVFPVDCSHAGHAFVTRVNGRLVLTQLAIALVAVESADIVFAVDSVPAVLAISKDPFIVFTSNIFAILGLRSLYFALAGCMERFEYLHYGLALVLGFVGSKMLLSEWVHIPVALSLGVIVVIVGASVGISLYRTRSCELPAQLVSEEDDAAADVA